MCPKLIHKILHCKLGHAFFQKIKHVFDVDVSKIQAKPCDVCHRAKQTRHAFFISNNKFDDVFELIHLDA